MKELLFPLLLVCYLMPASAQEGYGDVDPGANGLAIGSKTNYSHSALVINGPCVPYYEANHRDIVFKFDSSGKSVIRAYRGEGWGNYLQFLTTGPNSTDATPIVRMHLNEYGNVGIGTTIPQSKLDVSGDITTEGLNANHINLNGMVGRDLCHPFTYDNIQMDNFALTWLNDPDVPKEYGYTLWASSSAGIKLFTSQQPRLTIDVAGNVGIGTITPSHKLDVNGTIRAKEIRVESGWADFVLKEGYDLPSLAEVEKHITEKGTLPGIPSESEVSVDGVNLGEMNVKLLQKVEELTLYVIRLQKDNEIMRKEIDELKLHN